jgi:arsenate reductase
MMMTVKLYEYRGCSTCRKARKWLEAQGIEFEAIPIVETPPSKGVLKILWERSGLPLRKLFNTSGGAYREGSYSERLKTMTNDEALVALAANGMLIKRPLVDTGDRALVGFREEVWQAALGS